MNITQPDFKTWAENIKQLTREQEAKEIERALRECFNQGVALGKRLGYEDGDKNSWWKEQDIESWKKFDHI